MVASLGILLPPVSGGAKYLDSRKNKAVKEVLKNSRCDVSYSFQNSLLVFEIF